MCLAEAKTLALMLAFSVDIGLERLKRPLQDRSSELREHLSEKLVTIHRDKTEKWVTQGDLSWQNWENRQPSIQKDSRELPYESKALIELYFLFIFTSNTLIWTSYSKRDS